MVQLYPGYFVLYIRSSKNSVLLRNCNLKAGRTVTEFDLVFIELLEAETQGGTREYELIGTETEEEVVPDKLWFRRAVEEKLVHLFRQV